MVLKVSSKREHGQHRLTCVCERRFLQIGNREGANDVRVKVWATLADTRIPTGKPT